MTIFRIIAKILIVIAISYICYLTVGISMPSHNIFMASVFMLTTMAFIGIGTIESQKHSESQDFIRQRKRIILFNVLLGWFILIGFFFSMFIFLVFFVP